MGILTHKYPQKQGLGISHTLVGVQPTIPWHMIHLQYPKRKPSQFTLTWLPCVPTRLLCLLAGQRGFTLAAGAFVPWTEKARLVLCAWVCGDTTLREFRNPAVPPVQVGSWNLPLLTGFYTSERWLIGISERINSTKFGKLKVLMFCLDQPSW